VDRAEIIREKGTNRNQFFRGQVDKYTWVDIGSSYLPSELIAAFLWAQMEDVEIITKRRLHIWDRYHQSLKILEEQGKVRRPIVPLECKHNAHLYYLLLKDLEKRDSFIANLKKKGIGVIFHYVPLDSSPMGKKYGRVCGKLTNTHILSNNLVRLPLWLGLEDRLEEVIRYVIAAED